MTTDRRLEKGGKINKCGCGRVILQIQTKKSSNKETSAKKTVKRRVDSSDDGTICSTSRENMSLLSNKSNGSGAKQNHMCLACYQQTNQLEGQQLIQPMDQKQDKIPLIKRLKVVKTTSYTLTDKSRLGKKDFGSRTRSLPREVNIVMDQDNIERHNISAIPADSREHYTEYSELGFDGISPTSTLDKMVPTRFTFDGIVPSQSSMDSTLPEDNYDPILWSEGPSILNDLAETERGSANTEKMASAQVYDIPLKARRERSRTTSTVDTAEMSIEFSEADFHKMCTKEDKRERDPVLVSSDEITENEGSEPQEHASSEPSKDANSNSDFASKSSWFDFSFLAIS